MKIFPLFAAGILAFGYVRAPDWILVLVVAMLYGLAWLWRKGHYGGWYVSAAVFLSGMLVTAWAVTREQMPRGERLRMVMEVTHTPAVQGLWQRTTARVGFYRPVDPPEASWKPVDERIELCMDTTCRITPGEQLTVVGYLNAVDTTGSRYGAFMRSRGVSARTYISENHLLGRAQQSGRRMTRFVAAVQEWAVERITRLDLTASDQALITALIAGEKRSLDRHLRADYAKTGMAHILAVSGLHMTFVLIFVNLLFGWTVLFRRGHLIKNGVVILALWGYAVMAGLSPSVIRAALMLSAGQLALAYSTSGNGYNITLGCAVLMLAANPFYLYDISFQLSFIAVLSILFFYPRLYRRNFSRNRIIDAVYSSFLLGAAAQIGTIPLVVYNFGTIPLIALLINPPVIFTAFLTIFVGLIWVIMPLAVLNGVCSVVLTALLWIQNSLVSWTASLSFASFSGLYLNGYGVIIGYLFLLLLAVGVKGYETWRAGRSDDGFYSLRK